MQFLARVQQQLGNKIAAKSAIVTFTQIRRPLAGKVIVQEPCGREFMTFKNSEKFEMYEVTSHSFSMQSVSNGSLSSGGSYGSGYYGDPSVSLLSAAAANSTYADMLLQPTVVCYAPTYTADASPSASCKQSCYHQEELFVPEVCN